MIIRPYKELTNDLIVSSLHSPNIFPCFKAFLLLSFNFKYFIQDFKNLSNYDLKRGIKENKEVWTIDIRGQIK